MIKRRKKAVRRKTSNIFVREKNREVVDNKTKESKINGVEEGGKENLQG